MCYSIIFITCIAEHGVQAIPKVITVISKSYGFTGISEIFDHNVALKLSETFHEYLKCVTMKYIVVP